MSEFRAPINLGERIGDDATRRSLETLVGSFMSCEVFRRTHQVALTDQTFGLPIFEYDEVIATQDIITDAYVSLTGTSVTITPSPDSSYVVYVVGSATFFGTPGAGDGWLQIHDGTTGYSQQLVSIPSADFVDINCAYVGAISTTTTFVLQSKEQAAGVPHQVYRSHLAVLAIPQSSLFRSEPITWTVPVYVKLTEAPEVVQRAALVATKPVLKNNASNYRFRFVVKRGAVIDVLASYDGRTKSLFDGVPLDLTTGDIKRRIERNDLVCVEITRTGNPVSLLGVSAHVTTELVGS